MESLALPVPPDEPPSDTIEVSVFRVFRVAARGRGIHVVQRLMPWLLVAGFLALATMVGVAFLWRID